jgi:5'-nucleotidase
LRALITNDDGIDSPGLVALAAAAQDAGWEVVIAAPSSEFSGSSAALTAVERDGRIRHERRELPGLPAVETYAVAASPAFIVLVAEEGGFGTPPDVVLSGINHGANVGRAITHSGTVGAALTAAHRGCRAAAFSVGQGLRRVPEPRWDTAAAVARTLLPQVSALPPGAILNVNVPDLDVDQLGGIRRTTLATFGAVMFTIVESGEGYVRMGLTDGGADLDPESDEYWLGRGWVTVTPLRPAREAADVAVDLEAVTPSGYPGQST